MSSAEASVRAAPRFRHGLAEKLSIGLVVSTALILVVYGSLNLRMQESAAQDMVLQSADSLGDLIQRSTRYEMLHNDREGLYHSIRDIGSEPGIELVRILNKEGRITFSTDSREVNKIVDKNAEACYACHARGVPLVKVDKPERWRIFKNSKQQRVMAVIRPIENDPSCSNAACHAHPASKRILGVIDTHISLAAVDETLAAHRYTLISTSLGALVLICAVSVAFVWNVVRRPIRALIAGTQRVAGGDLDQPLGMDAADELGELAASFDKMTERLAMAHGQLTGWAKTLEDRVATKTRELERANHSMLTSAKMAALGNLAATVAHEVNNPLFAILTYARLALKDVEHPDGVSKVADRLRIIERESLRCGGIMRNLLTFARQTPKKPQPNDVNALIGHALALVSHRAQLQSIDIESDLSTGIPPVDCDAGQIQQTVLVLLVNAIEAIGSGGKLRVTSELDQGREEVRVSVADNGPGVPPSVMAKIFDPFFTTKEDQHRTGLGLAIARSIVEQHGGLMTVKSIEGQGAEFVFTLPLVAVGTAREEVSQ